MEGPNAPRAACLRPCDPHRLSSVIRVAYGEGSRRLQLDATAVHRSQGWAVEAIGDMRRLGTGLPVTVVRTARLQNPASMGNIPTFVNIALSLWTSHSLKNYGDSAFNSIALGRPPAE